VKVRIEEVTPARLAEYASIPMTLEVRSILNCEDVEKGLGGLRLREEKIEKPYVKDYDSYEDLYEIDNEEVRSEKADEGSPERCEATSRGEQNCGPESWPGQFDISNWGLFIAYDGESPVGAAAVAWNTAGVNMLEGRADMAVLWDIRVHPLLKGQGIGSGLFVNAANWARSKGCKLLKIETQNVNVPACRFYVKKGCRLGQINRYGYYGHPQVSNEVMLCWYLDL
jgi:GNAT superfamily N-acetyltransferase